jgi:hypothetical protein
MASRCLARRSLATPSTGLQRDAEAALVPCKFVGCDRASVGLRRGLRSGVLAILASHAVSCIESRCPPMCRVGTATRLPEARSHHNQKFFLRINTRASTGEFRGPSQARPPLWAARKPRPGHTGQAPVPLQTRPPRSKFAQVESELGYPGCYFSATYFVLWINLEPLPRVLSDPVEGAPRSLRAPAAGAPRRHITAPADRPSPWPSRGERPAPAPRPGCSG